MGRTELPWLLWGRHVRPLAFGLSLSCAALFLLIVTGGSVWGQFDPWSVMMAALAALACIALWVGFWVPGRGSTAIMQHGLMGCAVLFSARSTYIVIQGDYTVSAWLTASLGATFAVMAGGSWLLERTTGGRGGEGE
jgi:hypothetical protein